MASTFIPHRKIWAFLLIFPVIFFALKIKHEKKSISSDPVNGAGETLLMNPIWTLPGSFCDSVRSGGELGWPKITAEARPGSYWWWPGSAVTRKDLTWNLELYRKAGWGNLGVIGIYGVKGEEDSFTDIFTPEWFDLYNHAVREAGRLNMNIDLTPSSGWRLGGPHVTEQYAEQSFSFENGDLNIITRRDSVKRAGPGGKGLCINPYSLSAVRFHFHWLTQRFEAGEGAEPRAFYYDSFENPGNWCPELPEYFRKLRGYSLKTHVAALNGIGDSNYARRVICDYRQTLSDMLMDCVKEISVWCKDRGSSLRIQAHGAPANLLDMYACANFPETEVFGANRFDIPGYRRDPRFCRPDTNSILVNRFASSAAHVAGRNIVISESFTWLRNHYHTALSHIKAEADLLFLQGINGIYYHGTCYSPEHAPWPGWLFYASTQVNSRNSIFRDIPVLNNYITRCQSILQEGKPYNDVLLYWPVFDLWMEGGREELRFRVHQPDWIEKSTCGKVAHWMIDNGYTFDFISDKQLLNTRLDHDSLVTEGNSSYRTLLIPSAKYMDHHTLQHIIRLAEKGATILFLDNLPVDVPGWHDFKLRKEKMAASLEKLSFDENRTVLVGRGRIIIGNDLDRLFDLAEIIREPMVDDGLLFTRRKSLESVNYFIANQTSRKIDQWIALGIPGNSAVVMDPMTGRTGLVNSRERDEQVEVYLQLEPGETRILRIYSDRTIKGDYWPVLGAASKGIPVMGTWHVDFVEGGPELPQGTTMDTLKCWTRLGDERALRFAGAARYTIDVNLPVMKKTLRWILDLGDVRESARITVNNQPVGVLVAHPFRIDVSDYIRNGKNEITFEVTNLSANRIRDLDIQGVGWKKFYDANIVTHMYEPFDASSWDLKPSGLLGPVTIIPYPLKHFEAQ